MKVTTRQITELTGKRHDNLKRLIERLHDQHTIGAYDTIHQNARSYEYHLTLADARRVISYIKPQESAELIRRLDNQLMVKATNTVVGWDHAESAGGSITVSANRQSHGTQLVDVDSRKCEVSAIGAGVGVGRHSTEVEDPNGWKPCTLGGTQPAVQQDDGEMKMNSIDLLEMVNSARDAKGENRIRHNDFNARITDELEGESYESFVASTKSGQKTTAYLLSKDQCILVAMRESKAVRIMVRDRLKALEDSVNAPAPQFKLPQTMAEALRLAADENEGRLKAEQQALEYKGQSEQYQKQIETQTPWVEFARTVSETGDNMMVREAAKALDVKPSKLFQHLKDWGWINTKRVPYQRHIDAGYLEYRVHNYTKPSGDVATTYVPLITGKGLESSRKGHRRGVAFEAVRCVRHELKTP
ncbi:phage antirepressor KilAC domain-containing protein [Kushneria sp. EE4]